MSNTIDMMQRLHDIDVQLFDAQQTIDSLQDERTQLENALAEIVEAEAEEANAQDESMPYVVDGVNQ